jgi:uncharacterized protein YndB with AHSA1/START domain
MKKEDKLSVRVTYRFSASAERVFDAWLDPEKVCKFLFVTATGQMVQTKIEARVGGGFTIVERRAGENVAHVGTYLEIDRPRRLVFMLSVPKYSKEQDRISVDIEPLGRGCELTLTHEMAAGQAEQQGRAQEGWSRVLGMLAERLPPEEPSCGAGLAQHASVPAKIAPVFAALAETLETHRGMLMLSDENARREDEVYQKLAAGFRELGTRVESVAREMAGARDLAAAAHDETAFAERQLEAFRSFVKAQNELLEILRPAAERDEAMLGTMTKECP